MKTTALLALVLAGLGERVAGAPQRLVTLPGQRPPDMSPSSHVPLPVAALEAESRYYTAFLFTERIPQGRFAVIAGPEHPAATTPLPPWNAPCEGVDVLRLSYPNNTWTVRSYSSGNDYALAPRMGYTIAEPGFTCVTIDDLAAPTFEEIDEGGAVVAVRESWSLDTPPDRLRIEQEARVVGETFASSSVAITLRVSNLDDDEVLIGARLLLNPEMGGCLAGNAGPALAMRPPDPPLEPYGLMERQWFAPGARDWDLYAVPRPSEWEYMYHVGGSVRGTPSVTPPVTPPDLLQYSIGLDGGGDGLSHACFGYDLHAIPRGVASEVSGPDNALAYLWGNSAANAIVLAPGATFEATTHVYAYIAYPITCGVNAPLAVECSGAATSVTLDAGASAAIDGSPLHYRWSSLDPSVSFDDPQIERPVATFPGTGTYQIQLTTEVGPYAASCATAVAVSDSAAPDITAPALVEARTSQEDPPRCGARVSLLVIANDLCAGSDVTVTNDRNAGGADAADEYPVGDALVTFTARDPSGNEAATTTLVRVIDDTPPALTHAMAQPSILWPPNHRMVTVRCQAEVADNCDPAPVLRVVDVRSSEPADGLGDGDMAPDFELVPGRGARLMLRAERSGRGPGRAYTVTLEATDASGNVSQASVQVTVPRDRRRSRR